MRVSARVFVCACKCASASGAAVGCPHVCTCVRECPGAPTCVPVLDPEHRTKNLRLIKSLRVFIRSNKNGKQGCFTAALTYPGYSNNSISYWFPPTSLLSKSHLIFQKLFSISIIGLGLIKTLGANFDQYLESFILT